MQNERKITSQANELPQKGILHKKTFVISHAVGVDNRLSLTCISNYTARRTTFPNKF